MSLIDRAKNILLNPKDEWKKIDGETTTIGSLFTGYAVILALLPAVGTLLAVLLSLGPYRYFGFNYFLISAVAGYVIGLGILYLMGIIANALAPSFDGTKSDISAMKLVVYSATATWVAGFFSFIPILGGLIGLVGFGYAAYLLYLGSQTVMKVPENKAIGYTAVTIIIWIVLAIVISAVIVGALISAFIGTAALTGAALYS
ncbi:MAG: Yip1 family protein [Pseudomonadota bacterium]